MIYKKLLYSVICLLLVMTHLLIPIKGYAEDHTEEQTNKVFIEVIEDAEIYDLNNERVGKVFQGTIIPAIELDDEEAYIQWDTTIAAIDLTSVSILENDNGTESLIEVDGNNNEQISFLEDTYVFLEGSIDPSFIIQKGMVYGTAKEISGNYYEIVIGGRLGTVHKNSVQNLTSEEIEEELPKELIEEAPIEEENVIVEESTELEPIESIKEEEVNKSTEEIQQTKETNETQTDANINDEVVVTSSAQPAIANFSTNDRYFEVLNDTPIYDNRTGQLVEVGTLKAGESYPRVRAYGANWHEVKFGEIFGYVRQSATKPTTSGNLSNIDNGVQLSGLQLTTLVNAIVYDNSSGSLVPFAILKEGLNYPIVSDYGGWYRISVAGRIGFINKNHVERTFNNSDRYFEVTSNELPIYDNRTGSLIKVGNLNKGQVYPRVRDYGANWHEIKFGNHYGYVSKSGTQPANSQSIKNINNNLSNSELSVTMLRDTIVYDNSSGALVRYATLEGGVKYPVISDYGNWYRIDVAGRIGYVSKNNVERSFKSNDRYFTALQNIPVYDNRTGSLVKVGTLEKGQTYPRVRDYGANWHEIKFGDHFGYVSKGGTQPASGSSLSNINTGLTNSPANITTSKQLPVYDNSSGSLERYAYLDEGTTYPVVSDYGNWYRILLADRIGYISKSEVSDLSYADPILAGLAKDKNRSQAIVVTANNWNTIQANVQTYEKDRGIWKPAHNRINAVLGRSGFMRDKREGDGGTPIGKYDLGTGFGWVDRPSGVQYPYRKTTSRDYWVDDVNAPDYNQWVTYQGNPELRWNSYERLTHTLYKYAFHIKYNEDPIVKGDGSAIFMHVWRNSNSATAGCVAVSEAHMVRTLQWLDTDKNPVIVMGPHSIINELLNN